MKKLLKIALIPNTIQPIQINLLYDMKSSLILLVACLGLLSTTSAQAAEKEINSCEWIQKYIVPVEDFPHQGILYRCYTDILKDPEAFRRAIQAFAERYREYKLDAIAGLDSRGFIFGAALSYELGLPFVMIRKPGKLPRKVEKIDYEMEFGKNSLEIELGTLQPQDRVLIIDDVVATGGTAQAASVLVERLGAQVIEVACLIELTEFEGRKKVKAPVFSLLAIDRP